MISLASDLTDHKGRHARGWLFFDAECEFCSRVARWLAGSMNRHGLALAPLQDERVGILLGLQREELLSALRFVASDGTQFVGGDAVLAVARELWWARPMVWLARLPGARLALRVLYQRLAQRLRCPAENCPAN